MYIVGVALLVPISKRRVGLLRANSVGVLIHGTQEDETVDLREEKDGRAEGSSAKIGMKGTLSDYFLLRISFCSRRTLFLPCISTPYYLEVSRL